MTSPPTLFLPDHRTDAGRSRWWGRLLPVGSWAHLLLVAPAACAAFTLAIMVHLLSFFGDESLLTSWRSGAIVGDLIFTVVIMGYNLLGPLTLAVLISVGSRVLPRGMGVITLACLAYTLATGYSLIEMIKDDSSTSVLLLLFLPAYLIALLVPFAAVAALVHRLRRR